MCCCDVLITDRISSVIINGEHHVELEQVHKLNKETRCRTQAEAILRQLSMQEHIAETCVPESFQKCKGAGVRISAVASLRHRSTVDNGQ